MDAICKDAPWGECYYDHYTRFLREPVERNVFRPKVVGPSIQILSYDKVIPGCRVFCSVGLSHYRKEIGSTAEVFLPVDAAWESAPYILANALFYIAQKQMILGRGLAVRGIQHISPNFTETFGKTALYFTLPYGLPDDFARVTCHNQVGHIYAVFFITEAEYDFFIEYGAEKFEDVLEYKEVDPYDLRRLSCI